jgi:flagellar hook-associated protein 3 FlgL
MAGRITTSMVQRNILRDLNSISDKLTKTQLKASSNKEITRPSDDPFHAARAMARRSDMEATIQHQRNAEDAVGWQEATEQALGNITESLQRARDLVTQGGSDGADQTSRESIAAELKQVLEGIKQSANATYRGAHVFAGAKTSTAPYVPGADDTFHGDRAGLDPAIPPLVREIGPGVSVAINVVGEEMLGNGDGTDGKLLSVLRDAIDHLESGDGNALRTDDLRGLDANLETILEIRARNGARSNRLDSAIDRLGQVEDSTRAQLSGVEDADIAKTLIELNSQSAAYQAALRSGASIVQSSLMDFLR